jgi:hypothetical protein
VTDLLAIGKPDPTHVHHLVHTAERAAIWAAMWHSVNGMKGVLLPLMAAGAVCALGALIYKRVS